ncbi:MAG: hypothetical protein QOF58_7304 [Pseudonocardiales bacterium]|jgi:hypothetical protein|nr:hypothetical protein [Pseudonocardiales bacterium]
MSLLVLHTLRCIGFAGTARIAGATGLSESDAESELIDLAVDGLVTHLPGEFGGWGLTAEGRVADAQRITGELESAGARPALTKAFHEFMVLNPELLDLCTAWQLRSNGVINDHSDTAYDGRVLGRFNDFHERAVVVCADLSAAQGRFDRYRVRLADALERAAAGELEYVADGIGSYHAVWAELHEDLLATLGIPR